MHARGYQLQQLRWVRHQPARAGPSHNSTDVLGQCSCDINNNMPAVLHGKCVNRGCSFSICDMAMLNETRCWDNISCEGTNHIMMVLLNNNNHQQLMSKEASPVCVHTECTVLSMHLTRRTSPGCMPGSL
jgi:hypothetical protein